MNGIMISGAFTDQDSNGYNYKNNGVYTYHPSVATLDNVGSNAFWYYHSVYGYPYVLIGSCYIDNIGIHVGAFSDAVDNSSSSECWGSMYDFLIYLYVCSYIANYYFRKIWWKRWRLLCMFSKEIINV